MSVLQVQDLEENRVTLYDTTLRDGAQSDGVSYSLDDKLEVVRLLDELGVDYIEGGFAGANDTDTALFAPLSRVQVKNAIFTAFGMTCGKKKTVASEDKNLMALIKSNARAICVFGKSSRMQVKVALQTSYKRNLEMIRDSVAEIKKAGKQAVFDAEHFFDGYKDNPGYALACLRAAREAGADWIVLCDTNGGTMPDEVAQTVATVRAAMPDVPLGIHAHNDCDLAVANSQAAVKAGAKMVQGTVNGIGERCGNANLLTIAANLFFKMGYSVGKLDANMDRLKEVSERLDDILERPHNPSCSYVGDSAFRHKAGVHASAVVRDPLTYEHIDPAKIGNKRRFPATEQSGKASLVAQLRALSVDPGEDEERLTQLSREVKRLSEKGQGYDFDQAPGSLIYLAMKRLYDYKPPFTLKTFSVTSEGGVNGTPEGEKTASARVLVLFGQDMLRAQAQGAGAVDALDVALRNAVGDKMPELADLRLVDYRVRSLGKGRHGRTDDSTAARTRVFIETENMKTGQRYTTCGVAHDNIRASLEALVRAYALHTMPEGLFSPSARPRVTAKGAAPQRVAGL